ncbi:MAG: hypothetical protein ABUL60_19690 [Myxococcales bacterium]
MTRRFISKARTLWPAVFAFAMASLASSHAAAQELPPPYEAWQGTGPRPPTAPPAGDLPPPLARPRELPRRPWELGASLAAFLPSCGSGSIDDRGCLTVSPGSGLDATLLYRVGPFFAFGLEGAASGFSRRGQGALSGAGGAARFFGVVGRVYFAEQGLWDPYLALTLGAGTLELAGTESARVSVSGLGGRVAGGLDFLLGSHFRVGPSASFAHWLAWRESNCSTGVCRDQAAAYGRLLGFATLGVRLTGSFGEVL